MAVITRTIGRTVVKDENGCSIEILPCDNGCYGFIMVDMASNKSAWMNERELLSFLTLLKHLKKVGTI